MALSPTANQSARPRANADVAARAAERFRSGEPQSGGDRGGPGRFLAGEGIPTSGGVAKPGAAYSLDRHNDQGGKRLYLGKAFENAQRPTFVKVKGNSEGKAEKLKNHETNTVSKAAKTRLSKGNRNDRVATGAEFAGQPFRRSSGAFGPQRADKARRAHGEHEGFPGRRMEQGGVAPKHLRSGG